MRGVLWMTKACSSTFLFIRLGRQHQKLRRTNIAPMCDNSASSSSSSSPPSGVTASEVRSFLSENSVEKRFFIKWMGYRANHMAHAAVALHRLGADSGHFHRYMREVAMPRLESRDGPTRRAEGEAEGVEDLGKLVGKGTAYYRILSYYRHLYETEHSSSASALVHSEFPPLCSGVSGDLLHPLIHLGYGISVGSGDVVLEGLAYLHHSHRSPRIQREPDFCRLGRGEHDVFAALGKLRTAPANTRKADFISDLVMSLRAPPEVADGDAAELAGWILDQAVVVYQGSADRPNNFYLLHGVTSSWAAQQLVRHLDRADALRTLFYLLHAVLVFYDDLGCPKIDRGNLEENEETKKLSWSSLRSLALSLPLAEAGEHTLKLVQVCADRGEEKERRKKEVDGGDDDGDEIFLAAFKRAAVQCMRTPYSF